MTSLDINHSMCDDVCLDVDITYSLHIVLHPVTIRQLALCKLELIIVKRVYFHLAVSTFSWNLR